MSKITKCPTCGKKAGQRLQRFCLGCWQPFDKCLCERSEPTNKNKKALQAEGSSKKDKFDLKGVKEEEKIYEEIKGRKDE